MNRKLYSRLLLASTLVFIIQCAPGFNSSTLPSSGSASDGSNGGLGDDPSDNEPQKREARRRELEKIIDNAVMTGYTLDNTTAPVISFDRTKGAYLIRVPMGLDLGITALDMTFKEYPGIELYVEHITINPNTANAISKPFVTLLIPVRYVLRNVMEVPARLPNGDRLPLFAAGEGPSKAILLTPNRDKKVYLYLSAEAFGVFAETGFDPVPDELSGIPVLGGIIIDKFEMVHKIYSRTTPKILLGSVTVIDEKPPFKGGFFLSHRIDPQLGKILDEYYLH